MDLLYTHNFDGFCIVTSDSDYTGLAVRLREEGITVYGFGEDKTPAAFRNACNKFVFTEVLRPSSTGETTSMAGKAGAEAKLASPASPAAAVPKKPKFPKKFLLAALEETSDENGWAHLGALGHYLNKLQPDFDSRLYGCKKLSDLLRAHPELFVLENRKPAGSNNGDLYVRAK